MNTDEHERAPMRTEYRRYLRHPAKASRGRQPPPRPTRLHRISAAPPARLRRAPTLLLPTIAPWLQVVSNPRLLMSSWGVLARLAFVLTHVTGGLRTIGVSSTIMTPKAAFATRFPLYTKWLHAQIEYQAKAIDALRMASAAEAVAETEDDAAAAEARLSAGIVGRQKPKRVSKRSPGKLPPTTASVAQLETRLGDLLEERLDPQLCEGGLSLTSFDGAFTEAVFDPDVEGAGYMTLGLK